MGIGVGPEVGDVVGLKVGRDVTGASVGIGVERGIGRVVTGLTGLGVGSRVGPDVGLVVGLFVGKLSQNTSESPQGKIPFQLCVTVPREEVMPMTRIAKRPKVAGVILTDCTNPLAETVNSTFMP